MYGASWLHRRGLPSGAGQHPEAGRHPLHRAALPPGQPHQQVQCSTVQYSAVQYSTIQYITRSIQPYHKHAAAVILFDSPGFQNPNSIGEEEDCHAISSHHYLYCIVSGEQPAAGFVDLCYNYLQERLQKLFIESQLEKLSEKEKEIAKVKDNVKGHFSSSLFPLKLVIAKKTTSAPLINLIDRTSSVQEQPQSSWAPGSR